MAIKKQLLGVMDRIMRELGIEDFEYEQGRVHHRVYITIGGLRQFYAFSASASDNRSVLNMRSDIRRLANTMRAAASGTPIPGNPQGRTVLDARRVQPRQPHHVGMR